MLPEPDFNKTRFNFQTTKQQNQNPDLKEILKGPSEIREDWGACPKRGMERARSQPLKVRVFSGVVLNNQ